MSAQAERELRLRTSGGLHYAIIEGYPKITASDEGIDGTEVFIMKTSDYGAFIAESFPPPVLQQTELVRVPPRRSMGGAGFLVTKTVEVEPFNPDLSADPFQFDTSAPAGTYADYLRVTVNYASDIVDGDNDQDPDDPTTFLEASVNIGGEFLNVPPKNVLADQGNAQSNVQTNNADLDAIEDRLYPATKTIPMIEVNLKWKFVLFPNWLAILNALGTLNSAQKVYLLNAEIETAMFMGVRGMQKFVWYGGSTAQAKPWELDYKFAIRRIKDGDAVDGGGIAGWNHVWVPKRGKWVRVMRKISATESVPLYQRSNPDLIFRAP